MRRPKTEERTTESRFTPATRRALLRLGLAMPLALSLGRSGHAQENPPDITDATQLSPGQFLWHPEMAADGPVQVVVDLPRQVAWVYRGGIDIGATRVSTGRKGYATPAGIFTILQKDADHHSSIYDDASMPFTERLTWGGVALHAGGLPGYPSSHGCVHLPLEFAKLLFGVTRDGTTVLISEETSPPEPSVEPDLMLQGSADAPALDGPDYVWKPEASPEGPLGIVVSGQDRRLYVHRRGIEIGAAPIGISGDTPLPLRFYVMDSSEITDEVWTMTALSPGDAPGAGRIQLAPALVANIQSVLKPGDTIVVTPGTGDETSRSDAGFTILTDKGGDA